MVTNGSGIRDTARALKISASTVMSELKKRFCRKNGSIHVVSYEQAKSTHGFHPSDKSQTTFQIEILSTRNYFAQCSLVS